VPDFRFPHLKHHVAVGPSIDPESWRLAVPGRGACYLLSDADDQPILLATAAGLRGVLVNRLVDDPDETATKRTDYRAITRHVWWRPTFSSFEANWTFLENARVLFPDSYRELIRHWRSKWVHVDPAERFPQFRVVDAPQMDAGLHVGPFATTAAARRVIETLEDLFDLCRYHEVLVQAPHGRACAYKEMGRCPAPCDGTVGLDVYQRQIDDAAALVGNLEVSAAWRARLEADMQAAAQELAFERAAECKAKLDRATELLEDDAEDGMIRPLYRLRYLLLQPGRRTGCPRAFVILPGRIVFLGEVQRRDRAAQLEWLVEQAREMLRAPMAPLDRPASERIGLIAWHRLRPDRDPGVWLAPDAVTGVDGIEAAIERIGGGGAAAE